MSKCQSSQERLIVGIFSLCLILVVISLLYKYGFYQTRGKALDILESKRELDTKRETFYDRLKNPTRFTTTTTLTGNGRYYVSYIGNMGSGCLHCQDGRVCCGRMEVIEVAESCYNEIIRAGDWVSV